MFEQGLRKMPDGTHGRCQGCLSKVMTRKRLLVGGLAFPAETAALNDHRLAMVQHWHRWIKLQLRFSESRDFCCSGLRFANFRPQSPLLLSSGRKLRGRKQASTAGGRFAAEIGSSECAVSSTRCEHDYEHGLGAAGVCVGVVLRSY